MVKTPSIRERRLMRDTIEGGLLWYVHFVDTPSNLKERFVMWVMRKLTPGFKLVKETKTLELPFNIEEVQEQLMASLKVNSKKYPAYKEKIELKFTEE